MSARRNALLALAPELDACLPEDFAGDLVLDSRALTSGDVFLAVPGGASDGRRFIDQALAQRAVAVLAQAPFASGDRVVAVADLKARISDLADQFYASPSASMALVAVTGTNGKTSVAEFCAELLRALGVAAGCIGTLGARLTRHAGDAVNTTPDIVSLQRQLAQWKAEGIDHVTLEASSHALAQGRLAGLSLHTGIFTNLSRDHLDYHGTEASYAAAKLALFERFTLKRAIYNGDDSIAQQVRPLAQCPTMSVSLENPEADVYIQVSEANPLTFRLHTPVGTETVSTKLAGLFNAFNVSCAIMAVVGMGYSFADAVSAARELSPVAGRMELLPSTAPFRVVVDYAHTPDAITKALASLRSATPGLLRIVVGCGGDRDQGKRSLMGQAAAEGADVVYVTSDNPRSEDPSLIAQPIMVAAGERAKLILDRREAIRAALADAQSGDTVLIAGKGHETYQEIQGRRYSFSDQAVAREWLGSLSHG